MAQSKIERIAQYFQTKLAVLNVQLQGEALVFPKDSFKLAVALEQDKWTEVETANSDVKVYKRQWMTIQFPVTYKGSTSITTLEKAPVSEIQATLERLNKQIFASLKTTINVQAGTISWRKERGHIGTIFAKVTDRLIALGFRQVDQAEAFPNGGEHASYSHIYRSEDGTLVTFSSFYGAWAPDNRFYMNLRLPEAMIETLTNPASTDGTKRAFFCS